jgi:glutamate synthase (NADPH/NADH) small chain
MRDRFDAVFLGIGLGSTAGLAIPGEDLDGVVEALDFIFQAHTKPMHECRVGRDVLVIGAGNTAVDVATQAVRLGARSVTIAYRRTAAEMPAFLYEYELAKADGVSFMWQVRPVKFLGADGRLTGVRLQPTGTSSSLADAEAEIPCDMVVKALGQLPLTEFLQTLEGIVVESGRLIINPETGQTGTPGVFAGGDCTSKGAEIVDAVQEGKVAARGIHEYVTSAP